MSLLHKAASPELQLTLDALREEVHGFVGRPAQDVLDESFRLLEHSNAHPAAE